MSNQEQQHERKRAIEPQASPKLARRLPADFDQDIVRRLRKLGARSAPAREVLEEALRLTAKHRCEVLTDLLLEESGSRVLSGPFAGMHFVSKVAEGCLLPKLLGCYEAELQPHIERAIRAGYERVLNIGSAEGYYAVGLARRMPGARISAFDTDPKAQCACAQLAAANDVASRVSVAGQFRGEEFAPFAEERTLLICDIEGGERELLDPERFPALRTLDLIVELHDSIDPELSQAIPERFAASHEITLVRNAALSPPLPALFDRLGHMDQLLAVWEWRMGPTPWAVMQVRGSSQTSRVRPLDPRIPIAPDPSKVDPRTAGVRSTRHSFRSCRVRARVREGEGGLARSRGAPAG